MEQWKVTLTPEPMGNSRLEFVDDFEYIWKSKKDNAYYQEYYQQYDKVLVKYWSSNGEGDKMRMYENDQAEIFDCAGQETYTVMTATSLTSNSLCIVMFNAKAYTDHSKFGPMIGTYIDIILSKTKECAIILVASHEDQLKKEDFLWEEAHKHQVFGRAKNQVKNRTIQKKKIGGTRIGVFHEMYNVKLISDEKNKIFILDTKLWHVEYFSGFPSLCINNVANSKSTKICKF